MKRDLALLSIVACLSLAALVCQRALARPAAYAVARIDGKIVARMPLAVDAREHLTKNSGYNLLAVEAGWIRVLEANCPDGRCVRQGGIAHEGAIIACVPYGLIITLEGGQGGIDAVSE